ncbi:hypothetical protein A6V39_00320 [Candidatus Mycoplasma haematobovis]|uniref:Uncharacterized protein n=1 Tax=Candidatus Mycoplasma haematobovis TaxID=432608 RepID=A0A1A9QED7_9MOLU|nr:hypothetical protein [Candidatus Mycoplasma haematobovis]OAL10494.1 hypothetical protein A6V39_00320 [Candidatus Mycoplasma haematobovis]
MPNAKLALLIGGGISTVVGGGAGVYYLTKDKTIEDSLNREGFKFAQTSIQYQVSFKELKSEADFINDLKTLTPAITADKELSEGETALKTWCNAKIKSSLSEENVQALTTKVKKYCVVLPVTAKAKLINNNYIPVTNWDSKFESIKTDTDGSIKADLAKIKDTVKDLNNSGQKADILVALEQWCKQNEDTNLNVNDADTIYSKVQTRCFNKE